MVWALPVTVPVAVTQRDLPFGAADFLFCASNGGWVSAPGRGRRPKGDKLGPGQHPQKECRSSGSGSMAVPRHHSLSGPSLVTAKCRWGASGDALPVLPT